MKKNILKMNIKSLIMCAAVLVILMAVLLLGGQIYKNKLSEVTDNMSEAYMREMVAQKNTQFKINIDNQFVQLQLIAKDITEEKTKNEESLCLYLASAKENSGFADVALIDNKGNIYTAEGMLSSKDGLNALNSLSEKESRIITSNDVIWDMHTLLLGLSVDEIALGENKILKIVAGLNAQEIADKLSFGEESGETYSCIIDKNGKFVVIGGYTEKNLYGSNLFTSLKRKASFDDNYLLEDMQTAIRNGESGMVSLNVGGQHEYMYYAPLKDTDWCLCMNISYSVASALGNKPSYLMIWIPIIWMIFAVLMIILLFLQHARNEEKIQRMVQEEKNKSDAVSKKNSQFLSYISHEIRTTMNGIVGMTDVGNRCINKPDRIKNCLDKISISSNHLLTLQNDILDMYKITSGKMELDIKAFNLGELLRKITANFVIQSEKKGLLFKCYLSGELEEIVIGDSLCLNQVLIKLLSNAVKFTQSGGTVSLTVRELSRDGSTIRIRFQVQDTGCGIAEENFKEIFDPYNQKAGEISRQQKGVGLGLPISKQLTELMGGEISVNSESEKGSIFTVDIPFEYEPEKFEEKLGEGRKILMINPDLPQWDHMELLLKKLDFIVDSTEDISRAFAMVKSSNEKEMPYSICIISQNVTEDAKGIIESLKALNLNPTMEIVLTGENEAELTKERNEINADAILCRPVFYSDVLNLVNILENKDTKLEKADVPISFAEKNVLIAEDNSINMEVAKYMLIYAGAYVNVAFDGQEAIDRFRESPVGFYDFILMDMQMPLVNGGEATKRIREMSRADAKAVKIFAMTANALNEDVKLAFESGMDAYILKPFRIEDVYNCYKRF